MASGHLKADSDRAVAILQAIAVRAMGIVRDVRVFLPMADTTWMPETGPGFGDTTP